MPQRVRDTESPPAPLQQSVGWAKPRGRANARSGGEPTIFAARMVGTLSGRIRVRMLCPPYATALQRAHARRLFRASVGARGRGRGGGDGDAAVDHGVMKLLQRKPKRGEVAFLQ